MNGWRRGTHSRPVLPESQPAESQPPQGGWLSQAVDFGASQTMVTPRRGVHGLGAGVAPPRGLAPAHGAAPRVATHTQRVLLPGVYRVWSDSSTRCAASGRAAHSAKSANKERTPSLTAPLLVGAARLRPPRGEHLPGRLHGGVAAVRRGDWRRARSRGLAGRRCCGWPPRVVGLLPAT